ncbi:MAG: coniferyl-aldehyde dehydrogenase [Myxococcota bacterium]|jgi:coniferyl-aldehyde dehydrogenase
MSLAAPGPVMSSDTSLKGQVDLQRAAFRAEPYPTLEARLERLSMLERGLVDRQEDLVAAIREDFGSRSRHETLAAEVFGSLSTIRWLRDRLAGWMRPRSRSIGWLFKPARGEVRHQPKGVVGVISPWNYPVYLSLPPLATALAAGNRVMLKPSEITPRTSRLLAEILAVFPSDLVSVVQGGVSIGQEFSRQRWDHLMYTGSTAVGRKVLAAAAENLVPCTLELGGKSPVIIHPSFPLAKAAARVVFGKLYNAGQTCLAPDYALLPRGRVQEFVDAVRAQTAKLYPNMRDNPDYTAIINDRHLGRLQGVLDDAAQRGARLIEVNPSGEDLGGSGKLPLTLVVDAPNDATVLQDEIFGPILPIIAYDTLDEAIAYVNDRPRPLALYYFDRDPGRQQHVLDRTHSGGACLNEVLLHAVQDELPFGGIGPSGMGSYHGEEGLETFSHRKAVMYQSRLAGASLLNPPYGALIDRLLRGLIG